MKMIDVRDAQCAFNPHGVDARRLYDTDHAQVMHLTLNPGDQLKRHITPVDVFFYVLEGKGIIEIGEEKNEVGPDTLIESPARIPHCWYNRGSERLRILVTKVPRPTESTKVL